MSTFVIVDPRRKGLPFVDFTPVCVPKVCTAKTETTATIVRLPALTTAFFAQRVFFTTGISVTDLRQRGAFILHCVSSRRRTERIVAHSPTLLPGSVSGPVWINSEGNRLQNSMNLVEIDVFCSGWIFHDVAWTSLLWLLFRR